jgi:choline dehydrogenase-like flavoprotein
VLLRATQIESGRRLDCDVCIVGAGAAGITLARSLVDQPLDVVVLESGGLVGDTKTQALYRGRSVGLLDDAYLYQSRLRLFGGATNHWAGLCAPLLPLDFEERPWVPHSGWPFTRATLDPWYARAQETCEIGTYDYELARWDPRRTSQPPFSTGRLVNRMWQVSPPTRFGLRYRAELRQARNVRVLLRANAVLLAVDEDQGHVQWVEVASLDGRRFSVGANAFVLACGGIENARLLLHSGAASAGGLGNRHDRVGRFFMDHPHFQQSGSAASLLFDRAELGAYTRRFEHEGVSVLPNVTLSDRAQREESVLGAAFNVRPRDATPGDPSLAGSIAALLRDPQIPRAANPVDLLAKLEPAPNPESRVRLGEGRDALGMREVVLDWRLTELDARTLHRSLLVLALELGASGRGRLHLADWLREHFDFESSPIRG